MFSRKLTLPVAAFSMMLLAVSCQQNSTESTETTQTDSAGMNHPENAAGPVSLEALPETEDFPNAALSMEPVKTAASGDSVKLTFRFNVKNYELKRQTSDKAGELCSNSGDGQHIHFILDNRPYVALYEPEHEVTLARNSEHYMLAFLSRSYHLSLKNKGVAVLYRFKLDENGKVQKLDNPSNPMVFYSRPKGDYLGKDTENVLLDFYVWNTSLGNDHQVKVEISGGGKDTTLMVSEWKPFFMKNLPMGKNTIKLTMTDKDGNKVEGDNTEVSRDFTLAQGEPMR